MTAGTDRSMPEVLKCREVFNMERLWLLLNTKGVDPVPLLDLLDNSRPLQGTGYWGVVHEWKRSTKTPNHSRFYSNGSLISLKKDHRAFIMDGRYVELDLRASNPTILYNLMKNHGVECPHLKYYLEERETVHARLIELCPPHVWNLAPDGLK
jgi:hypothetical protein